MIKGVNKKVVEINNPRSIYFERAVFYLKPNMSLMPEKLVSREAEEFLREITPERRKKAALWKVMALVSAGVSAVCVTVAVLAAVL